MATSMRITRLTASKLEIVLARGNPRRNISAKTTSHSYSTEACQSNVAKQFARQTERKWMRICSINSCGPWRTYCTSENQNPGGKDATETAKESAKIEEVKPLQAETSQAASDNDQTHEVSDTVMETRSEDVAETIQTEAQVVDQSNTIQTEASHGNSIAETTKVDETIIEITPVSASVEDNITIVQAYPDPVVSEATSTETLETLDDIAPVSANTEEVIQAEQVEQAPAVGETESPNVVATSIEADSVHVDVEEAIAPIMADSNATSNMSEDIAPVLNDPADQLNDVAPVLTDSAPTLDDAAPVSQEPNVVVDKPDDNIEVTLQDSAPTVEDTAPVLQETDTVNQPDDNIAVKLQDSVPTVDATTPVSEESTSDKPADNIAVAQQDSAPVSKKSKARKKKSADKIAVAVQASDAVPVQASDDATSTTGEVEDLDEADILYKRLILEVKCHDRKVLYSYDQYMRQTAKLLDLKIANVTSPKLSIYRQSVLTSAHIYKKHQTQYEERTHYRTFEFKHLTGSTANTLLEYVQRNLPEGAAMKVTRHQVLPIPAHLKPPKQRKQLQS